jgi:hypothetical protein
MNSLPHLNSASISYTWDQLLQRAGVRLRNTDTDNFNIPLCYTQPDQLKNNVPSIIVVPTYSEAWLELLNRLPNTLDRFSTEQMLPPGFHSPNNDTIPVLFWGYNHNKRNRNLPVRRQQDGSVVFYVDIIATTLFMLSRWEETVVPTRDEHGRFPATASVAYKQGFLDRPIVDEYAMILRAWLKVLRPNWEPKRNSFRIKLSHDIDHVQRFPNWRKGVRTTIGDLLKRRNLELAKGNGIDTLARVVNPGWDRYYQGIQDLAELSKEYGLGNDAFYFMAAEHGLLDEGYDVGSPFVKECIEHLVEEGFEIGLHPSYRASDDPSRIAKEKARLDAVLGHSDYGGRYHYLRFQPPESWRYMEQAGLTYDATMTYAEQPGFRCGTCHPFQPFDIEADREIEIVERPLIAMEKTFQNYQGFSPSQTLDKILQLARKCRRVEGEFSLLWHNGSKQEEWGPSSRTYGQIVRSLAEMEHD